MNTTRRTFLGSSLAASSLLALPRAQDHAASRPAPRKLKLLVLGGTRFLGPATVRSALARGHSVTLFNRGRSRTHLFPEAERIVGDATGKNEGLANLEKAIAGGKKWDAVIDDIAMLPLHLKPRLALLEKATSHYVLISSISAYAKNDRIDGDESGELATVDDEDRKDIGPKYEYYGGLKAACERLAEQAFPGRCTNVRPGFIVGPEDNTDRFTYWPVRYDRGGDMLWPGTPEDPLQIIDARDLGAWLVHVVETGTFGTFNACGPAEPWTMGGLLAACKAASTAATKPIWVPADFLAKQGLAGDDAIPIWMPPSGESRGFHRYSNKKARKAGLVLRDPAETTKDTLEWFKKLPAPSAPESRITTLAPEARDNRLAAGPSAEVEQKVLAAFAKKG